MFGSPELQSIVFFFTSRINVPRSTAESWSSEAARKVSLSGFRLGFTRTSFALRGLWTSWHISGRQQRFLSPFSRLLPRFSPGLQEFFSCRVRERVSGIWGADVAQERQVPARFSCVGSQVPGKVSGVKVGFLCVVQKTLYQRVCLCARAQGQTSDCPVEKYFSASMLQDPWEGLRPVAVTDRRSSS